MRAVPLTAIARSFPDLMNGNGETGSAQPIWTNPAATSVSSVGMLL